MDGAMTSDAVRWVRALTLASVLFTGGLAGHAAADGFTPAISVLIPLFMLTVVAVGPFVGAPMSPAQIVASLLGGQVLLHAALQLLGRNAIAGMTTPTLSTDAFSTSSFHHMSCHMMAYPAAPAAHDTARALLAGSHAVMLFAHLAAAMAVGVWLVAGERVVWTLLSLTAQPVVSAWRLIRNVGRDRGGAVVKCSSRLQAGWRLECAVRGSLWTAGVAPRRGPPHAASPETRGFAALVAI
jgi:hypothetical protein